MGQRHVCTFRHAQRAAYRTAISAAQILVSSKTEFKTELQTKLHKFQTKVNPNNPVLTQTNAMYSSMPIC